jgi:hypothetical protein
VPPPDPQSFFPSTPDPRPAVSVVIIFFNSARFIEEAIESIFAQTFHDWELLLVDDGSQDASPEIARRYASRLPDRVRYLHHEGRQNRGMSASRNLGIREARGDLLAFLDADDVLLPQALQEQTVIMEAYPTAAMTYGPIQYWYSWTGRPEDAARDEIKWLRIPTGALTPPPTVLTRFLAGRAGVPTGIMVRTETARRLGGFDEEFTGLYEDQIFVAKVCLTEPVYPARKVWYRYRQHPEACTAVSEREGSRERLRLRFLLWLEQYLQEQGSTDPDVRAVLQEELAALRDPRVRRQSERRQMLLRIKRSLRSAARLVPRPLAAWVGARLEGRAYVPPPGWVRFGHLRRMTPLSQRWGFDRGRAVDRYYIEGFLARHQENVQGRVLEIADDTYTIKFGGDRVTHSDVLHVVHGRPNVTLVGDLQDAPHLPAAAFDCVILTQTLHLIYDVRAALRTVHRILKPGGVLLVTVPGITRISRFDMERWGEYWRFTSRGIHRMLEDIFPEAPIQVEAYGNVLAATAFLYGLAAEELTPRELDHRDPDFEVVIGANVRKRG